MFSSIKEFEAQTGGSAPTQAERALIEHYRKGEPCILNSGERPDKETDSTSIRASLLQLLITGESPECHVLSFGVHLEGSWVKGKLDLSFAAARGRTILDACHFLERPNLFHAKLRNLSLQRCYLPGLDAGAIEVDGAVMMRDAISIGEIQFPVARIGHKLDMDGAKLDGRIGDGKWRRALYVERAWIGNSVFLRRIKAIGRITVSGTRIGGVLSFQSSSIEGKIDNENWGAAILAERVVVFASTILKGTETVGRVVFTGAQIGGQLDCTSMVLDGKSVKGQLGVAFRCERINVKERLIWRKVEIVEGRVDFMSARIGYLVDDIESWPRGNEDQLRLDGFVYDRIAAEAMVTVRKRLDWLAQAKQYDGVVLSQPYTQLARVLRGMGHDRDARKVLIERERLMALQSRKNRRVVPNGDLGVAFRSVWADLVNPIAWSADLLVRQLTGYGYRAHNSFIALALLFGFAWVLAETAWNEGSFAPNSDVILTSTEWRSLVRRDCLPKASDGCIVNPAKLWSSHGQEGFDWDSFHAAAYAADLVVPILSLGQTDAWAPSRDRGFWGGFLWWARWLFAALGWIVTAFGAAAITGIIQKERE